ncbi:PREDICTED: uncharacterized protein LOC105365949 [Ceratosolen solmsi marchali]|uniref:Uncharacterized protein LOC105365949 n=1 Tax=Ceratosolen solmsi marchali TaxID=326594 RepID=A0AAJ6YQU1_9HYME|nr:PREDICTED: uncharacterized protein LOC105365949 [Ceratosolen solmsi marchali]
MYQNSTHINLHDMQRSQSQCPELNFPSVNQNQTQHCHRSPVDILLKVFPKKRRVEMESLLHRCRGDIISTMESLICEDNQSSDFEYGSWSRTTTPASVTSDISVSDNSTYVSRPNNIYSSQSPLTRHRFLAAPYSGTGYLPTVIRPQNQVTNINSIKNINPMVNIDDISDKSSNSD